MTAPAQAQPAPDPESRPDPAATPATPPEPGPARRAAPRAAGYTEKGSWGRISDAHWTRLRRDSNTEALEYYRQRSKAPGVREGGSSRNFYCMSCDGVIPYEIAEPRCPHCGVAIEPGVRRYFNWVESEMPRGSDLRSFFPLALGAVALLALLVLGLWWWLR